MPNTSSGTTPQPPSLEKRLPIALALMMLVLLASQYFFKPAPGPKPVAPVDNKAATALASKPTATPPAAVNPETNASVPGQISASAETADVIDTDLYKVTFTNRGATVKSWVLKRYTDTAGKPLEVNNAAAKDEPLPFSIDI